MSVKNWLALKSSWIVLLAIALTPTIVAAKEIPAGNQMENRFEQNSNQTEGNVEQDINCSQAAAAEEYWTPERMQNAQPLPLTRPVSPKPVYKPDPEASPEVSAPSSKPQETSPGIEER